jgi:hypothetical protein
MPFQDPVAIRIAAFLDGIGIPVIVESIGEETLLPAMTVRNGALVVDPDRLEWPGDMLHEAGHIAVTDPALRTTLCAISSDPGEEMAAMAWSYAAALKLGIDVSVVFHEAGYRGGGAELADSFTRGSIMGVPMLDWFGMTAEPRRAKARGMVPFPHMHRWLRQPGSG